MFTQEAPETGLDVPLHAVKLPPERRSMAHKNKPAILVIDDGLDYARVVADQLPEFRLITPEGQPCLKDGPSAMSWLQRHAGDVDVVLLDMHFDIAEDRLLPLPGESSLRRQKRFQGVAILLSKLVVVCRKRSPIIRPPTAICIRD